MHSKSELEYYLSAYMHQDWRYEAGSDRIEDSWSVYFEAEAHGDTPIGERLARLINEISNLLYKSDSEVFSFLDGRDYNFENPGECRDWLLRFKRHAEACLESGK